MEKLSMYSIGMWNKRSVHQRIIYPYPKDFNTYSIFKQIRLEFPNKEDTIIKRVMKCWAVWQNWDETADSLTTVEDGRNTIKPHQTGSI